MIILCQRTFIRFLCTILRNLREHIDIGQEKNYCVVHNASK